MIVWIRNDELYKSASLQVQSVKRMTFYSQAHLQQRNSPFLWGYKVTRRKKTYVVWWGDSHHCLSRDEIMQLNTCGSSLPPPYHVWMLAHPHWPVYRTMPWIITAQLIGKTVHCFTLHLVAHFTKVVTKYIQYITPRYSSKRTPECPRWGSLMDIYLHMMNRQSEN